MSAICRLCHDAPVHKPPVNKYFQGLWISVLCLYFYAVYGIPFIRDHKVQLILFIKRKANLIFSYFTSGVRNLEQPVQFIVHKCLRLQTSQSRPVNQIPLGQIGREPAIRIVHSPVRHDLCHVPVDSQIACPQYPCVFQPHDRSRYLILIH